MSNPLSQAAFLFSIFRDQFSPLLSALCCECNTRLSLTRLPSTSMLLEKRRRRFRPIFPSVYVPFNGRLASPPFVPVFPSGEEILRVFWFFPCAL